MKYFNNKKPTGIPCQRMILVYNSNNRYHPFLTNQTFEEFKKKNRIILNAVVQKIPKTFAHSSYIVLQEPTLSPTLYSLKQSLRWYTIFRISRVYWSA
ncbi:MAG TPA: hypothetical protein DCW90_11255 [Lachnospiraceae bacterium]|nr:hypothetical protein [Lachnospiraceae bacterium]